VDQRGLATTTLTDNPQLLWEYPVRDGVTSTPAIEGGFAYIGTLSGQLLCLELRTGKLLWSCRSIETTDPKQFAPGFRAPVTLTEELVLAGDEDGTLHAIDRKTGQRRWSLPTEGEVVGGVSLRGSRLVFGSHGQKLYCLETATGEVVWEFDTQGPVNGSPTIADRFTFVTGCDQPILRVVDLDAGTQHDEVPLEGLLIATPAIADEVLYFGTNEGTVYALEWRTRRFLWEYADPARRFEIHSSPAVTDELVLIGSRDKRLHAIDRRSGKGVWTFATRASIDCSPVVVGDRVYFGSGDKHLYGLQLSDGQEVWKYNTGQSITGSPAIGESCLVIGTDASDGRILCFGQP
jgi:outer membrane protein assembly factor BamB